MNFAIAFHSRIGNAFVLKHVISAANWKRKKKKKKHLNEMLNSVREKIMITISKMYKFLLS